MSERWSNVNSEREEGCRAFQEGKPQLANPYPSGRMPHEDWAAGWSAAKWAARVQKSADEAEESRNRAARIIAAEQREGLST